MTVNSSTLENCVIIDMPVEARAFVHVTSKFGCGLEELCRPLRHHEEPTDLTMGQIVRVQPDRVQDSLARVLPFSSIVSMTTRWTPPGRGMENDSLRTWSGPPAYAQGLQ